MQYISSQLRANQTPLFILILRRHMQDNELPRIVKILLHLLQRRDLELKTAATSFLIRLYAQVERERKRERDRQTDTQTEREGGREGGREGEREMHPDGVFSTSASARDSATHEARPMRWLGWTHSQSISAGSSHAHLPLCRVRVHSIQVLVALSY